MVIFMVDICHPAISYVGNSRNKNRGYHYKIARLIDITEKEYIPNNVANGV